MIDRQGLIETMRQIRDGVSNHLSEDKPEIKALIAKRLQHCVGDLEAGKTPCEYFEQGGVLRSMFDSSFDYIRKLKGLPENELKSENGKKCSQCGCSFQIYLKSPEKTCPKNKW